MTGDTPWFFYLITFFCIIIGSHVIIDFLSAQKQKIKKGISNYSLILDSSPFPVVIISYPDALIFTINDRASDILRILSNKAISKKFHEFFENPDELNEILKLIIKEGKVIDYETKLISRQGRFFWALLSANLISLEEENAVYIAFADINHQKELEITIQKNKELYRSVIRTSPDNITMVDMLGRIFMVSPAATKMFGYDYNDRYPYGMPFIDNIHPSDHGRFKHDLRQLKQGKNTGTHEYRAIRRDGSTIYIESHSEIIHDSEGRADSILYIIRDITRRKETESAIRENEERFITIFQEVPDPVLIFTPEGTILDINRQCEEWFKVEKYNVIGHSIQEMGFFQSEIGDSQFKAILSLKPGEKYETTISLPGNNERYAILTTRSLSINGSPAILLLMNDIDSLTRAYKSLSQANYQISLLNSITRHDIMNKVMAITGYSELLLEECKNNPICDTISIIHKSGEDITNLIEFTREYQDLGIHQPRWQRIDKIIKKDIIQSLISGINISLPQEPIELYADPLLEKVLYNLIENSKRHGEIVTHIYLKYELSPDLCYLIYEDDGIGVVEAEKELIFKKGHGKNTGLGLFLIREILQFTGIIISETGLPGKGVRFEMKIPPGAFRISPEIVNC